MQSVLEIVLKQAFAEELAFSGYTAIISGTVRRPAAGIVRPVCGNVSKETGQKRVNGCV